MSKRRPAPNFYGQVKKIRISTAAISQSLLLQQAKHETPEELPTDTETTLVYLKNKFPVEKFLNKLPPVLLLHQVYSIIKNRTKVDQDISNLRLKGVIRTFKLGGEEQAVVIIYYDDLLKHVETCFPENSVSKRFLKDVLPQVNDVGIEKELLQKDFHFTEQNISELVSMGLLTMRSESSYWFSFPNAGEFMKTYLAGRKSILRTIKKSKFGEMLQNELEKRKLEKSAKLGTIFHIHDIIGAELVTCVETTSGTILRFEKQKK